MNDLIYASQQLHYYQNKLDNWKLNGYDTPIMTYHEQMDEYVTRVQQLQEKITQSN